MRKSWIYAIILLSLYSCGSYTLQTNKGYEIKSILAVTEGGDTISVPYKDFLRERYDNYTRFNYNNNWYWNNWRYDYNWRWNYYWNYSSPYFYDGAYYYNYNNSQSNITTVPRNNGRRGEKVTNTPRPRPGAVPGVLPRPKEDKVRINIGRNENNRFNLREQKPPQINNNGGRSWNRQIVPSQSARPRFSTPSQSRQIRGGSSAPRIQQTQPRGGSSKQGSRPID